MLNPTFLLVPSYSKSLMWSADSVRGCCIACDYYTLGDNRRYSEMLDFVNENEPSETNIYAVALDILQNSDVCDRYGCTEREAIKAILFELYNRAVTVTID